jgi:hypothetical protein
VAQALDHGQQRSDICSVAGPQEGGNRPVLLVQHDAQHYLIELRTEVLGVATLTERGAAAAFEIQRCGVGYNQVSIRIIHRKVNSGVWKARISGMVCQ